MNGPDIVKHKIRRSVGISALRKIGRIIAEERQADADNARELRWFARYGWAVLLAGALLLAYLMGAIRW